MLTKQESLLKFRFSSFTELFNLDPGFENRRTLRGAFSDTEDYLEHGLVSSKRCASRTSSIGSWSENIKPSFTQKLTFRSVLEGQPVVFRCKLVASPLPKVSWFHNNKPIGKDSRQLVKTESDMHVHDCSLLIKSVEDRDSGSYRIFAINSEGSAESTASLLVALREEQNTKYLDFVRYSEKTHESIDSLIQKRRDSRLKVDLRCVGSPHDKRRETQILRSHYPKKGIVRTISFEKLSAIDSYESCPTEKIKASDKLVDKEIQKKLQRLREIKKAGRGSRSVSISSSDVYSDADLESLQSDASSVSYHVDKERYKVSNFSNLPEDETTHHDAKVHELETSSDILAPVKEPIRPSVLYDTLDTGFIDSSSHKKNEGIELFSSELIDKVNRSAFHEIFMKESTKEWKESLHVDIEEKTSFVDASACRVSLVEEGELELVESKHIGNKMSSVKLEEHHGLQSSVKQNQDERITSSSDSVVEVSKSPFHDHLPVDVHGKQKFDDVPFHGRPLIKLLEMPRENDGVKMELHIPTTILKTTIPQKKREDKMKLPRQENICEIDRSSFHEIFKGTHSDEKTEYLPFDVRGRLTSTDIPAQSFGSLTDTSVKEKDEMQFKLPKPTEIKEPGRKRCLHKQKQEEIQLHSSDITKELRKKYFHETFSQRDGKKEEEIQCPEPITMHAPITSRTLQGTSASFAGFTTYRQTREDMKKEYSPVDIQEGTYFSEAPIGLSRPLLNTTGVYEEKQEVKLTEDTEVREPIKSTLVISSNRNNKKEMKGTRVKVVNESSFQEMLEKKDKKKDMTNLQLREPFQMAGFIQSRKEAEISQTKSVSKAAHIFKQDEIKLSISDTVKDFREDSFVESLKKEKGKGEDIEIQLLDHIQVHEPVQSRTLQAMSQDSFVSSTKNSQELEEVRRDSLQETIKKRSVKEDNVEIKLPKEIEEPLNHITLQKTSKTSLVGLTTQKQKQEELEKGSSDKINEEREICFNEIFKKKDSKEEEEVIKLPEPTPTQEPVISRTEEDICHTRLINLIMHTESQEQVELPVSKIVTNINESSFHEMFEKKEAKKEKEIAFVDLHEDSVYENLEGCSVQPLITATDVSMEKDELAVQLPVLKETSVATVSEVDSEFKTSMLESEITSLETSQPCPPMFTSDLESKEALEGKSCTFTCNFYGYPQPTVSWYNNDKSIPRNEDYVISTTGTKSTLTFCSVLAQHEGSITCVIFNQYGTDTTFGKLMVKREQTVDRDTDEVLLQCELLISKHFNEDEDEEELLCLFPEDKEQQKQASDVDRFSLQLPQATYDLPCKSDDSLVLPVEIKVTAPTPIPEYEDYYEQEEIDIFQPAEVPSEPKSPDRNAQKIKHKFKFSFDVANEVPKIVQGIEEQIDCKEGDCVLLECILSGEPQPMVMWYQNNKELEISDKFSIEEVDGICKLSIKDIKKDDGGEYKFVAQNRAGAVESISILEVHDTLDTTTWLQQDEVIDVETVICRQEEETPINDQNKSPVCPISQTADDGKADTFRHIDSVRQVEKLPLTITVEESTLLKSMQDAKVLELEAEKPVSKMEPCNYEKPVEIEVEVIDTSNAAETRRSKMNETAKPKKELPEIPKRRHSFVRPKSATETDFKALEEKTIEITVIQQSQSSVVKEMKNTDLKKDLPVVPQRRHSLVRKRSQSVTESRTIIKESVAPTKGDQSLSSVTKEAEKTETKKELPIVPQRKRSLVRRKSGTDSESKPLEVKSINTETAAAKCETEAFKRQTATDEIQMSKDIRYVDQIESIGLVDMTHTDQVSEQVKAASRARYDMDDSSHRESKLDNGSLRQYEKDRKTTSLDNVETFTVVEYEISQEAKTAVISSTQYAQNIGNEQEGTGPSVKRLNLNLGELVKKDDVKEEIEIKQDMMHFACKDELNISNDELILSTTNKHVEHEEKMLDGNLQHGNENYPKKGGFSTNESISGLTEPQGDSAQMEPSFSLAEYLVTEGEHEVFIPQEVSHKKEPGEDIITSLEVEDVSFNTFYEFYQNQSTINRSLSPESEMSLEVGNFSSDDVLGADQFYTPPSSVENFRSPLSEVFLTPVGSPERYFTPVEQMLGSGEEAKTSEMEHAVIVTKYLDPSIKEPSKIELEMKGNTDTTEKLIEIETPPAFIRSLPKKRIYENSTLNFTTEILGVPAPVVKWFRKSLLLENDTRTKIEKVGNLHILEIYNVQMSEGGEYFCIAENVFGEAKSATLVEMLPHDGKLFALPPPVTHQHVMEFDMDEYAMSRSPSPQDILLEVELDEDEVKDFEKQVKIITIPEFSPDSKSMVISLDVLPLAYDDQGVGISNRDNDDVKINFEANERPPRFLQPLADLNVQEESDAEFKCSVTGIPQPVVKWFKGKASIIPDVKKYVTREDGNNQSLVICGVNKDDSGTYVCQAVNHFGEVTTKALLHVIDLDVVFEKRQVEELATTPLEGAEGLKKKSIFVSGDIVLNNSQTEIEVEFEFDGDSSDVDIGLELVVVTKNECEEGGKNCIDGTADVFATSLVEEDLQFGAEDVES
ncbi:LOW QUALITY PROTEIN: uncharacterized protein RCH25_003938 [Pelodytes ibericus]